MKNKVISFNNSLFGEVRFMEINKKPYAVANDIAKALGYSSPKDAISRHCKGAMFHSYLTEGGNQELKFIPEGDIYRLIIKSKLPSAEKFESWVFDEVLPTVREHGAYLTDDKIEEILSNPDTIIKLATDLKEKRAKIKKLEVEVIHKEDVIIGLVENISLAEKRQRINQIVKYKVEPKNFSKRWNLLYGEFEKKYHMDLKRRISNCNIKPKIKNKVDYIDRELNMIPQLYEIVCKLFENDVEELKNEWISVIEEKVC
ncbi:transporter [Clostridioides difficile]|nr:transporter [Clostridioides difficile]NJK16117.1 transporter [Clostridioides difficile]